MYPIAGRQTLAVVGEGCHEDLRRAAGEKQRMNFLAISGSARRASTNTALLRALAEVASPGDTVEVCAGIGDLPVFSPDLEDDRTPPAVAAFVERIRPEYVRSIPGGLKNAIDWLVSGDAIVGKPVALLHASHRGDDMLEALRTVLATVTARFEPDVFARFDLMAKSPEQVRDALRDPDGAARLSAFLSAFKRAISRSAG